MINDVVLFKYGDQSAYELSDKDPNTLYFVTDTKRIYKGDILMASDVEVPDIDGFIKGVSYNSGERTITFERENQSNIEVVLPPDVDLDGVVKNPSYDAESKTLTLPVEGGSPVTVTIPDGVDLNGYAKNATWDSSQLILTIPMEGKPDLVVNIPKDKFVTAGSYNPDTKNIELTIDGQEEKVYIPASDLVDVYTADNDDKNVTVTITDDNKVSANITISSGSNTSDKSLAVDANGNIVKYDVSPKDITDAKETAQSAIDSIPKWGEI